MRTHTERELRWWLIWLREQWNEPDRTDHYLMAIASEIRHKFADKATPFDKFRIVWGEGKETENLTPEEKKRRQEIHQRNQTEMAKAVLRMRLKQAGPRPHGRQKIPGKG